MRISFDKIKNAADAKFGSLTLEIGGEEVIFANPARLGEEKRKEFAEAADALSGSVDEDGENPEETEEAEEARSSAEVIGQVQHLLSIACSTGNAELVFEALGEDQALWMEVVSTYFEALKVGEASASQS